MWNVVHKKKFRVCQWSGQLIGEEENTFRIPEINAQGKVEWKGCFSTPNCALAAMKKLSDERALPVEKHSELVSIFQNSINKVGGPDHVDIKAAPSPASITQFGGTQTTEQYRESYDPGKNMGKWFLQTIPAQTSDNTDDEVPNSKSQWKHTVIGKKTKCNDAELVALPPMPMQNPRNMLAVVNYLKSLRMLVYPDEPAMAPFVVYTHPKKDVVAIGTMSAVDWADNPESSFNLAAHKLMGAGNTPLVYGDVVVLHKKPLKFGKQKRAKKAATATTEPAAAVAPAKAPKRPLALNPKADSGSDSKPKRKRTKPVPAEEAPQPPKKRRRVSTKSTEVPIPEPLPANP
jgi:hypothetical protein